MNIKYSSGFERMYKKVSPDIKLRVKEKEALFRSDPFDSKLKTHKLHGALKDHYSFSVNHTHRIIFRFIENENALFLAIGNHDIYD